MSSLQVFNTLSGKKEEFLPISGKTVLMYACGPTVYDYSHLGHARMAIVWDVVQRYLRHIGYDVTFVRNITDVDDKIIERASKLNTSAERVAREFTYTFWYDMHRLNVAPPDYEPRCTEFILPMIAFIEQLIDKGHAYESEGDVYFEVSSFKQYGKLGKKNIADLMPDTRALARSKEDLGKRKKSPVDFALWKGAPEKEPGWHSPWGHGRPGWHLECSTMIKHVLGETIDIHAGGQDLVFPHHENEIAQSNCLHGKPLAKYWLHNSFVNVSAEKMSKSLGNFSTIDGLLLQFSPDTIRLFVLTTHYRHPIDFTDESLSSTRAALSRLLRAAEFDQSPDNAPEALMGEVMLINKKNANGSQEDVLEDQITSEFRTAFQESMDNDFNTAQAVSHMFGLADRIFNEKDPTKQATYARLLRQHAAILGLTLADTRKDLDSTTGKELIDLVLELRQNARGKKDFQTSDLIRDKLVKLGISVMDGSHGQATWERF
ncbi:MAG: cysteine--tRNA ligase [Candidatus Obscuribacterales bacterium]|nr:cysteine--tRNA ligase [Candidatus Obscuribacterales bacterium]